MEPGRNRIIVNTIRPQFASGGQMRIFFAIVFLLIMQARSNDPKTYITYCHNNCSDNKTLVVNYA
jgi:hypothetical protein